MARQEIHVTFDPSSNAFSFSPERAVLNEQTAVVDVILHTAGDSGPKASFAESNGIRWMSGGPRNLEVILNPARTALTLRGFPRNETQGRIDYGYTVNVDYEGEAISSPVTQYPLVSCVQTGGGG